MADPVKYNARAGQFITITRAGSEVTFSLNTSGAVDGDAIVFNGGVPTWGNISASGPAGADGTDGREVELQSNGTHIQWRYSGELAWVDLVALSQLQGPTGDTGATGKSAYEVAVDSGFVGTESEWLSSLGKTSQGFSIVYNASGDIEKLVFDDATETVLTYSGGSISQIVTPTSTKTLLYDVDGTLTGISVS